MLYQFNDRDLEACLTVHGDKAIGYWARWNGLFITKTQYGSQPIEIRDAGRELEEKIARYFMNMAWWQQRANLWDLGKNGPRSVMY